MENFTVVQSTRLSKLKRLNVKLQTIYTEIINSGLTNDLEFIKLKTEKKINKLIIKL